MTPDAALPWHGWACELSLAYGWTPSQIAEMTIAQMWIYLTRSTGPGGRRRMSPAEATVFCQRRRAQRQRWIREMIEKHHERA